MTRCVVTGGGGFIGAYLVRKLVSIGWHVVCVDNMLRGDQNRLVDVLDEIDFRTCDVRDVDALTEACRGAEVLFHLAAINGTENFYSRPELVLDVGVRGALAAAEACRKAGVPDLVMASSAEVYQQPPRIPTDETVPLTLPDTLNPRYSYGGSKIVTELIAFNYGKEHFRKVQVFRPHNVYGPNMGWKHVAPQFILRAIKARETGDHRFPIQSDGTETRAFAYVDDIVEGILLMQQKGADREIYHIGNDQEITIRQLVEMIGHVLAVDLQPVPGPAAQGGARRRCPDISKMRALGYAPQVELEEGMRRTVAWYAAHQHQQPANVLM